jgi:hypothetical protein
MSNYIFYQVEESIQGDLGYLLQDFGNSPTQISRFLGLGESYRQTVPATDQIGTCSLVHIKEHSKLHILSSGGVNPGGFGIVGAGVWEISHTNFEIFGFWGTIWTNGARHRPAMAMGVLAYSRGCQTVYSIKWAILFKRIWHSWCRILGILP